ncbi:MAG TPA: PHP domain-containing protein [Bryobacteraceae bacterium]|jgi:predicted metal-dependent phosphoesterase TrpH|nr:PHP domain-containing protein [Bryobacteraceae bacterium]
MIDLHSHTDRSDGTFTPSELVAEAVRVGLTTLAITDHDTFAGYDAAVPYATEKRLDLICGIELSTRYQGTSVHLLGYFPAAPPSENLRTWLEWMLEMRRDRNIRLIAKLQSLGVDITLSDVEKVGRTLTGRPHFAQVLVAKGYATDIQNAFDKYLDESARGFVQRQEATMEEALERILESGGVPSLAHPVRVAKNNWNKLASWVEDLAGLGMRAIEVYHSDHSPENVSFYASLAERFNLGITGGSDFHGANKPSIALGTGKDNNLFVPDSVAENLRELAARH